MLIYISWTLIAMAVSYFIFNNLYEAMHIHIGEDIIIPLVAGLAAVAVATAISVVVGMLLMGQPEMSKTTPIQSIDSHTYLGVGYDHGDMVYIYYLKNPDGSFKMDSQYASNTNIGFGSHPRLIEYARYSPAIVPHWMGPVDNNYTIIVPKNSIRKVDKSDLTSVLR